MKCEVPMRHLGEVDIVPFKNVLAREPESLWTADLDYQKSLAPVRDTRTIYLVMTKGSVQNEPQRLAGWEPFREVFEPIAERLAGFFESGGRVVNAQIAMLEPGGRIPRHFDRGPILEACHRIHVPLETHARVVFEVDGDKAALEVGHAYELDNMRQHSVLNASPIRRIHLIVDYYDGPVQPVAAA